MTKIIRWRICFPNCRRLFNATQVTISPANEGGLHAHDFAEVFWVGQGIGMHIINGRHQSMQTGDLCMIRPLKDAHKLQAQSPDFTIVNIAFPVLILNSIRRRYYDSSAFWGGADHMPGQYHLTAGEQQWLGAVAIELLRAPQDRLSLDRFLLNLLGSTGRSIIDPYRACPEWLRTVCNAIQKPECLKEGIKGFFALTHRSPEHVARTLKKYTGKTPTDMVNEARLAYASGQLLTTNREIINIALDCGFNSLSNFYALFHRTFDMSPHRYRLAYFKMPIHSPFYTAGE